MESYKWDVFTSQLGVIGTDFLEAVVEPINEPTVSRSSLFWALENITLISWFLWFLILFPDLFLLYHCAL